MIEFLFLSAFLLILVIACVLLRQANEMGALRYRLLDLLTRVELLERKTKDEDHA